MLVLRPPGRGNWQPVRVMIDESKHAPQPMLFKPGDRVPLAGVLFRVVRVHC